LHSTKIDKHTISDPVKQKAVEKAEEDEVELILEGLKAVKIISESEVNRKTHRCHIFTMDEFLANRQFDSANRALSCMEMNKIFIYIPINLRPLSLFTRFLFV